MHSSTPSQAPQAAAPAFVGDGQFAGDGGALLQRLWDAGDWTMIRGCPGRYVLRGRRNRPARVAGAIATALDTRALLVAALGEQAARGVRVRQLPSARCADVVAVSVLTGGGGVLTYCKRGEDTAGTDDTDGDVVHVHTLNTASGLQRKLEGLGLGRVLRLDPSSAGGRVDGLAAAEDCESDTDGESGESSRETMRLRQQELGGEADDGDGKANRAGGHGATQLSQESVDAAQRDP